MNTEISKKFIIHTEIGYYAGINKKYSDIINFSLKKYAYVYETKEEAEVEAKALIKARYDIVEIKEVISNYIGEWRGGCFIVGEQYSDCELMIN